MQRSKFLKSHIKSMRLSFKPFRSIAVLLIFPGRYFTFNVYSYSKTNKIYENITQQAYMFTC